VGPLEITGGNMPLAGEQLKPRQVALLLWDEGWVNAENLMTMVAVTYAESNHFTKAWNHNPPTKDFPNGTTDWGYLQLNDSGKTGTALEEFKKMAFDPKEATHFARKMYEDRWFQPWAAYNSKAWEHFIYLASKGVANMLNEKWHATLIP